MNIVQMAKSWSDKSIAMNEQDIEKMLEGIDFKNLSAEPIIGEWGLIKSFLSASFKKRWTPKWINLSSPIKAIYI